MSVAGILDAMRTDMLPAYRLVWICLENHAERESRRWSMTTEEIASEVHISADTVSRALVALNAAKIIEIKRHRRRKTEFRMLRRYTNGCSALAPQSADSTVELTPQDAASTSSFTPHAADSTDGLNGHSAESNDNLEPQAAESTRVLEPQLAESTADLTPQIAALNPPMYPPKKVPPLSRRASAPRNDHPRFREFYDAYPRKDTGPRPVSQAFSKAVANGADPEEIIAGLKRYRFSPDPDFRPMGTTWLNQQRWLASAPSSGPRQARASSWVPAHGTPMSGAL